MTIVVRRWYRFETNSFKHIVIYDSNKENSYLIRLSLAWHPPLSIDLLGIHVERLSNISLSRSLSTILWLLQIETWETIPRPEYAYPRVSMSLNGDVLKVSDGVYSLAIPIREVDGYKWNFIVSTRTLGALFLRNGEMYLKTMFHTEPIIVEYNRNLELKPSTIDKVLVLDRNVFLMELRDFIIVANTNNTKLNNVVLPLRGDVMSISRSCENNLFMSLKSSTGNILSFVDLSSTLGIFIKLNDVKEAYIDTNDKYILLLLEDGMYLLEYDVTSRYFEMILLDRYEPMRMCRFLDRKKPTFFCLTHNNELLYLEYVDDLDEQSHKNISHPVSALRTLLVPIPNLSNKVSLIRIETKDIYRIEADSIPRTSNSKIAVIDKDLEIKYVIQITKDRNVLVATSSNDSISFYIDDYKPLEIHLLPLNLRVVRIHFKTFVDKERNEVKICLSPYDTSVLSDIEYNLIIRYQDVRDGDIIAIDRGGCFTLPKHRHTEPYIALLELSLNGVVERVVIPRKYISVNDIEYDSIDEIKVLRSGSVSTILMPNLCIKSRLYNVEMRHSDIIDLIVEFENLCKIPIPIYRVKTNNVEHLGIIGAQDRYYVSIPLLIDSFLGKDQVLVLVLEPKSPRLIGIDVDVSELLRLAQRYALKMLTKIMGLNP